MRSPADGRASLHDYGGLAPTGKAQGWGSCGHGAFGAGCWGVEDGRDTRFSFLLISSPKAMSVIPVHFTFYTPSPGIVMISWRPSSASRIQSSSRTSQELFFRARSPNRPEASDWRCYLVAASWVSGAAVPEQNSYLQTFSSCATATLSCCWRVFGRATAAFP